MSAHKFYSIIILLLMSSLGCLGQGLKDEGQRQFEIGQMHHKNGAYDSARYYFEAATSTLNKETNLELWVPAMSWLGWSYMDLARNSEADSVLTKAIEEAEKSWGTQHPEVAFAYHILSKTYASRGWHKRSNEHVRKSLGIREALYDSLHVSMGENYEMFGFNYRAVGQYDSAIYCYTLGLQVLENTLGPEHLKIARMLKGLAWVRGAQGDIRTSLELNNRALDIQTRDLGEGHPLITSTLGHNCWCYNGLGDYPKALGCQEKVLAARRSSFGSDHPTVATDLVNVGYTLSLLGDFDKAIRYQKEGVRILESLETPHVPQLVRYHAFLASNYEDIGDYDMFFYHSQRALELGTGVLKEDDPEFVIVYRHLANYYKYTNQQDQRLLFLKKALNASLKRFGKEHRFPARVKAVLGDYYQEFGSPGLARKYHQDALSTFIRINGFYHPAVAEQLTRTGSLYFAQGAYDSALYFHQQSLQSISEGFDVIDFKANPLRDQIISEHSAIYGLIEKAKVLMKMSEATEKLEQLSAVVNCLELATELIDEIRNGFTTEASKQQLYERASEAYDLYMGALRALYLKSKDELYLHKALEVLEASRSFILIQSLNDRKASRFAGVPQSTLERERDLRIDLTYLKKRLFRSKTKNDTINIYKLSASIFELQGAYDTLISKLEADNPTYFALKYPEKLKASEFVHSALLDSDEAFIEYYMADNRYYVFVVLNKDIKWLDLGPLDSITNGITDFRKSTTDYDFIVSRSSEADDMYLTSARMLHQYFLDSALKLLPQEVDKLTIVPDGALRALNLEALLTADVDRRAWSYAELPYLMKAYELRYAYSLTFLDEVEGFRAELPTAHFAGFAPDYHSIPSNDVNKSSNAGFLQGASQEVESIREIYAGASWLGKQATETNFKSSAGQYQVLHLAMHGRLDNDDPLYSDLIFEPEVDSINDGYLEVSEIYNLQLRADLVVLSACNTGSGVQEEGEGSISLSRAFAYAGSPSVIMSLWKIPDEMTSRIMVELHNNLKAGTSKIESLRAAKMSYLKQAADTFEAHPFFWAGFVLMGDGGSVDFVEAAAIPSWLWLLVVFGLTVWIFSSKFTRNTSR